MENLKGIAIGGAAALVVIGGILYTQLDNWFTPDPTGPGSGEEMPYEPEPRGPGSDDYYANLEDEPTGPGSGEELPYEPEPTGPGSGEELPYEPEPQGPGSDDYYANLEDEPTGPGSGEEINVAGSCNTIDDASTCIDYIGSYWATPDVVSLNCQGVGTYSTNPCPQPTSGGCQGSAGTNIEMIIWYYPYGGDPISGELITYAAGTCNATGQNYIYEN